VTYEGALLNQSGKFFSCATYEPMSVKVFAALNQTDPAADKYGDFSLIRNGLWNNSLDVTSPQHGIECLWVPTDGTDYFFQRFVTYYGTALSSLDTLYSPSNDGAHINYVDCGTGLPPTANVRVEVFANFELIADPNTAPFLAQVNEDVWDSKSVDKYHKVVSSTMKNEGLIRPASANSSSWTDVIKSVADVGIPLIKSLLI
jgi:hypothetical protein